MVQGECPDYIIAHQFFFSPLLLESKWFQENYSVVRFYEAPIYGSTGVFVYRRNLASCVSQVAKS